MSSGLGYNDGRIMCQHCFDGFWKKELWKDAHGEYWDVCKQCKADEYRNALVRIKYTVMNHPDYDSSLANQVMETIKLFWDEV